MYSDADSNQLEPEDTGDPGGGWLARGWTGVTGLDWYRDPDSYWRRRFFILAGGLALVGGITWGLSALLGPAKPISTAGPGGARAARGALPPAAYGAPAGAPQATSSPPAVSGSASPSVAASPSVTASPSPGAGTGKGGSAGIAPCSPASIVLSLFTSQPRYSQGQQPRFDVYAVSTAPGACELAYGSSVVRVVVTRAGQVIWDSATCRPPTAAKALQLAPGVPEVAAVTWNRRAATLGCAGSVPARASGTFAAVAMADGKSSPVRSFVLSRS